MIVRIAVLALIAACSSHQEKGRAKECIAYTAPAGWTASPSKLTGDLALKSPDEYPLGDKAARDTFTIDYVPFKGSLDAFKTQFLAMMTQANLDRAIALHAKDNAAITSMKGGVPESTVTATKLGGRDAFRLENRNLITVNDNMQVMTVNRTVFAKFGDDIVVVAVGSLEQREAHVKPLAEAFLASINFDRCK